MSSSTSAKGTIMAKRGTSSSRDDRDAKFLPSEDVIQKRAETVLWLREHGFDRQFIETMMQHDFENALPQCRRMAERNGKSVERIELLYYFLLDD